MGLFGKNEGIARVALGVSGAFDPNRKTDKAAAFGTALGRVSGENVNSKPLGKSIQGGLAAETHLFI